MTSPCADCNKSTCPSPCYPLKDHLRHLRRIAKTTPCYNCPDRKPGCHGACPEYTEWTKARAELARLTNNHIDEAEVFRIEGHTKARNRKNRKGDMKK